MKSSISFSTEEVLPFYVKMNNLYSYNLDSLIESLVLIVIY